MYIKIRTLLTYTVEKILKIDEIDIKYCDVFSYSVEGHAHYHILSKK